MNCGYGSEYKCKKFFEARGWTAMKMARSGYFDFLFIKKIEGGYDLMAVEVKSTVQKVWVARPRELDQFRYFKEFLNNFPFIKGETWIFFKTSKKLLKINTREISDLRNFHDIEAI